MFKSWVKRRNFNFLLIWIWLSDQNLSWLLLDDDDRLLFLHEYNRITLWSRNVFRLLLYYLLLYPLGWWLCSFARPILLPPLPETENAAYDATGADEDPKKNEKNKHSLILIS